MNQKEKLLASKMLQLASETFSNHGCNDVPDSFYEGWTLEERQQFVKEFHQWNEHREDPIDYDPNFLHLGDDSIMAFLAHKLTL